VKTLGWFIACAGALIALAGLIWVKVRQTKRPKATQSMSVEVYHIVVDREKLRAMSRDERGFLLSLGYSANQVSMLQKLLIFSSNNSPPTETEQTLSAAQTQ